MYKECKFTDIKVVLVTLSKLQFKRNFPNFPNYNTSANRLANDMHKN